MSEETEAPAVEPTPAPEVALAPVEPTPEPEAPARSELVQAIDAAVSEAEHADASFVREVVDRTHHLAVSLLHSDSSYIEIPETKQHGPRLEQIIGR